MYNILSAFIKTAAAAADTHNSHLVRWPSHTTFEAVFFILCFIFLRASFVLWDTDTAQQQCGGCGGAISHFLPAFGASESTAAANNDKSGRHFSLIVRPRPPILGGRCCLRRLKCVCVCVFIKQQPCVKRSTRFGEQKTQLGGGGGGVRHLKRPNER